MPASQLAAQLTAQHTDAATNSSPVRRVRPPVASRTPTTAIAAQLTSVIAAAAGWSRQYGHPARSVSPATAKPAARARLVSAPNHGGDRRLRGADITTTILSMLGAVATLCHRTTTAPPSGLSRTRRRAGSAAASDAREREGPLR